MADQAIALPASIVPAEVHAFAIKKGAAPYLEEVINLTRRVFPAAPLAVSLGEDAEDETHRYIALDVTVRGLDAEGLLAAQQAWSSGLMQVCPSRSAVYFVLGWQ